MPRVVVGVDASRHSVEALRWAVDEARWRCVPLEVLYAFAPPEQVAAFPVLPGRGRDRVDTDAVRRETEERLSTWLANSEVDLDGIEVTPVVVADAKPARALIDRSSDAALIVVAARGRGGFAGLRLGSVPEQVVRHARCAVLVVRPGQER